MRSESAREQRIALYKRYDYTAPDEHILQLHIMSIQSQRERETDRQTERERERERKREREGEREIAYCCSVNGS